MPEPVLQRIPVVAGIAYLEHVRRLPSSFTAILQPEPGNQYFHQAIAVVVNGGKVGYVAPEIARGCYAAIAAAAERQSCPGRRASHADHEGSGVELLLDFSRLRLAEAG
jgi:hypothetical protein